MKYQAFISYSHHADKHLAPAVQKGLHLIAKPWYRMRALRIFRDEAVLTNNSALWDSIKIAIDESEYFILMASPEAADSDWVKREINYWKDTKPKDRFMIVLTAGEIKWDPVANDFDWEKTTAIPKVFAGVFSQVPKITDLCWAHRETHLAHLDLRHSLFRDNIAEIAARLHGKDKDEIESEDIRQQRQTRRIMWGAIISLLGLLALAIAGFVVAQNNANIARMEADRRATQQAIAEAESNIRATAQAQAEHQTLIAQAGELSAIGVSQLDSQLDLALLLVNEAYRESNTIQNLGNLQRAWIHQPKITRLMFGHQETVWSVAFSPDGKVLASGGEDGTIRFWNIETGQSIGESIFGHTGGVRVVTFNTDGTILASGGEDNQVRLWQVSNQKPIGEPLVRHQDWVYTLSFSPDSKLLASGSSDRVALLWNVQTGLLVGELLVGHQGSVTGLAFSPDGAILVTASTDRTLQLWDVKTGQPSGDPLIGHTDWVTSVAFSPDGQMLASGGVDKTLRIWDVPSRKSIGEPLIGHSDWVYSVAFSPDGTKLVSGSLDATLRLWDPMTGQLLDQQFAGSGVVSIAFSPDSQLIATGNSGSGAIPVRLYSINPNKLISLSLSDQPQHVTVVKFSPDGSILASGGGNTQNNDNDIRLVVVDQPTLKPILLQGHTDWINSLAFSPDGGTLASAAYDHTIRLWNLESHRSIAKLVVSEDIYPEHVVFSIDGELIISGNSDGTVQFWGAQTKQKTGAALGVQGDTLKCIAISQDGKLLAYAGEDKDKTSVIRLIDIRDRKIVASLTGGHTDWIVSLVFSPDGKYLASGSGDQTIRIWDVQTGTLIGGALEGHNRPVVGLVFSPSGKILFSASADSTWRLWDVGTGQPIGYPIIDHTGIIWGLDISPDGQILATGGDDAVIRLWDVTSDAWMDVNCERAGRNISQAEWQRFVYWKPFDPNFRICRQWPLGK